MVKSIQITNFNKTYPNGKKVTMSDPAITEQQATDMLKHILENFEKYVDSNAMSYEDENGNKLTWIKKNTNGHNAVGFDEFDPTKMKTKLKEGISAGPEREVDYSIGDSTGSIRKINKIDEVNLKSVKNKLKKATVVGTIAANLGAHAGKMYDVANVATHRDDPAMAAATVASYLHPASKVLQSAPTVFKVSKAGQGENEFARQKAYGSKRVKLQEAVAKKKEKARKESKQIFLCNFL